MSENKHFDAVVLGGGMAGVPLAMRLAFKGFKVALIERDKLGGTCLNIGCIPTKAMIASAKVAHQAREAERWGVLSENVRVDINKVIDRKAKLVTSIRSGTEHNVENNENITLIRGDASFTGPKTLQVNGTAISGERIFINTGARNVVPDIAGLPAIPHYDSTTMMELRELPEKLLIVGGGFIGVEFAQMFRRFGSKVTLVQRRNQLLPAEDEDIAKALQQVLEQEGIEVLTNTEALRVSNKDGLKLMAKTPEGERTLIASHLMLAAGRKPNTDSLNLELTGVETDERGFIKINDRLETSAAGIWALGDVRGGDMFTHTARDDARIIYQNLLKNSSLSIRGRVVPYAVFSDPQLGRVGLNEKQARQTGYELKIGRYEGKKVAKARALGEASGLIKIVADAATDKILGASILLPEGAEVVHELVAAIKIEATYRDLSEAIHIHPTLAEGVSSALGGVHRAASDSA